MVEGTEDGPHPVRRWPCERVPIWTLLRRWPTLPNPAALQAVPPANVRRCPSCISASGDRASGCVSWMHRRMSQRQQETNAAVRIWGILPNQKSGEGKSAVLAAAIGSKRNHPAESSGWPQKRIGPIWHRFRKRQFGCTMRASLTCIPAGRHVSWACLPFWVRRIESKRLPLIVADR